MLVQHHICSVELVCTTLDHGALIELRSMLTYVCLYMSDLMLKCTLRTYVPFLFVSSSLPPPTGGWKDMGSTPHRPDKGLSDWCVHTFVHTYMHTCIIRAPSLQCVCILVCRKVHNLCMYAYAYVTCPPAHLER